MRALLMTKKQSWWRQPWANTVLYVPMKDDLSDHSNNHFTLTNTGVSLVSNQADIDVWYFDGSSYLSWANDALFNFGDMHISTWINFNTTDGGQFIFAGISIWDIFFGEQLWEVWIWRNRVAWDNWPNAAYISLNNWHYISLDRTGTSITISVDLVNIISGTNNKTYTPSWWYRIGDDGYWNYVRWYMSDLIIENKWWTAQELSDYFNQTKSLYGIS